MSHLRFFHLQKRIFLSCFQCLFPNSMFHTCKACMHANSRYRKCLFPRRDLSGGEKGPRDEVDLVAYEGTRILLAECKPQLSDSFRISAKLFESDYTKLKRIQRTFTAIKFSNLLRRLTGVTISRDVMISPALVVGSIDYRIPADMTVLEFSSSAKPSRVVGPLSNIFLGSGSKQKELF